MTLVAAGGLVLLVAFIMLHRYAAPAMRPYYQCAIAGLVVAGAIAVGCRLWAFGVRLQDRAAD